MRAQEWTHASYGNLNTHAVIPARSPIPGVNLKEFLLACMLMAVTIAVVKAFSIRYKAKATDEEPASVEVASVD